MPCFKLVNFILPFHIISSGLALVFLVAAAPAAKAATVWNRPTLSFTHTDANGRKDKLPPGVALPESSDGDEFYAAAGEYRFNEMANSGLACVVQSSTNLQNWISLVTNVATGSVVSATNPATTGNNFSRAGWLPNE